MRMPMHMPRYAEEERRAAAEAIAEAAVVAEAAERAAVAAAASAEGAAEVANEAARQATQEQKMEDAWQAHLEVILRHEKYEMDELGEHCKWMLTQAEPKGMMQRMQFQVDKMRGGDDSQAIEARKAEANAMLAVIGQMSAPERRKPLLLVKRPARMRIAAALGHEYAVRYAAKYAAKAPPTRAMIEAMAAQELEEKQAASRKGKKGQQRSGKSCKKGGKKQRRSSTIDEEEVVKKAGPNLGRVEFALRWIHNPELVVMLPEQITRDEVHPDEEANSLLITLVRCRNLPVMDTGVFGGSSDPYCIIKVGDEQVKSTVRKKDLNPVWVESFELPNAPTKMPRSSSRCWTMMPTGRRTRLGDLRYHFWL